jgi:hypothetical protein
MSKSPPGSAGADRTSAAALGASDGASRLGPSAAAAAGRPSAGGPSASFAGAPIPPNAFVGGALLKSEAAGSAGLGAAAALVLLDRKGDPGSTGAPAGAGLVGSKTPRRDTS